MSFNRSLRTYYGLCPRISLLWSFSNKRFNKHLVCSQFLNASTSTYYGLFSSTDSKVPVLVSVPTWFDIHCTITSYGHRPSVVQQTLVSIMISDDSTSTYHDHCPSVVQPAATCIMIIVPQWSMFTVPLQYNILVPQAPTYYFQYSLSLSGGSTSDCPWMA